MVVKRDEYFASISLSEETWRDIVKAIGYTYTHALSAHITIYIAVHFNGCTLHNMDVVA